MRRTWARTDWQHDHGVIANTCRCGAEHRVGSGLPQSYAMSDCEDEPQEARDDVGEEQRQPEQAHEAVVSRVDHAIGSG